MYLTVDDKNPQHYVKGPKLWELWSIPYYGQCRISIIHSSALNSGPLLGSFSYGCCTTLGSLENYPQAKGF